MTLTPLNPRKALNKAFLKVKPNRTDIEAFKANLIALLDRSNDTESEEFHKNLVSDFLKKTYYEPNHFINTKGRNDLVIHNGDKASSTVGVILEAKKPTNKGEMIATGNINKKAFQELVLYYLRERIKHKNLEVKYLIITNINEWFIFDATTFDRLFAQNKALVGQFTDFEEGRLSETKTDFFYKQIAEPFIAKISAEIEFTYFNLQDYQKPLRNDDPSDDHKLIALFKLLSPEHLLKKPFANDSNSLDKRFYSELLHIIGLTETKEGGKKLIQRNKENERNTGSILEDAIIQLDSMDKLSRLSNLNQFGSTTQDRLFNVSLELSITWINRILFLKLLEAQLLSYNNGDASYAFLNFERIRSYDDLNSLFFQVLARKHEDRNADVKNTFAQVPYLNSSLFEPTEIEQDTLFISNLRDDKQLPILPNTVLKDQNGKKRSGKLGTLEYLFEFLNAYDFGAEGSEEIQEDNKTLINASVLGLIFEKINGYKDGSFFTPGFITMYMCRETIRKAVVQKFNEAFAIKHPNVKTSGVNVPPLEGGRGEDSSQYSSFNDVYNAIGSRRDFSHEEAAALVNAIKICDPAVGSGHFLVSALNEMIAVKHELGILSDREGKFIRDYDIAVENDELVITDANGELFEYKPNNKESQRIQETLFHEKQSIIENCLFGVDINPNSVKICRLRLWIELLKNAYYETESSPFGGGAGGGLTNYPKSLQTLPNIDINIKCGNSLVSRFAIDADLSTALKKSKWTIDSYRSAVATYRNAESKEQKREMERLIADIKSDFRSEISLNDPKLVRKRKIDGELFMLTNQQQLFEMERKEKAAWNKKVDSLTAESKKLEIEIEEIKANKIFENAFEWRFEFPEVLDNDGKFVGFDVVIGNPPYFVFEGNNTLANEIEYFKNDTKFVHSMGGKLNAYKLFLSLAPIILKPHGINSQIFQISFLGDNQAKKIREYYLKNQKILKIDAFPERDDENKRVFDEAKMSVCILQSMNTIDVVNSFPLYISFERSINNKPIFLSREIIESIDASTLSIPIAEKLEIELLVKVQHNKSKLKDIVKCNQGELNISIHKKYFQEKKNEFLLLKGAQVQKYYITDKPSQGVVEYVDIENYILDFKNPKSLHHKEQRIVMQGITGVNEKTRIKATLSNPNNFCGHSCNYILISDFIFEQSLELLGFLNSKLYNWIFKISSTNSNVNSYEIDNLPILFTKNFSLSKIVNQILELKKQNPSADTTALESQIDALVYELYGLSEEEIRIVEGSLG
jgi:adenine-specific DNA-methyltransferase